MSDKFILEFDDDKHPSPTGYRLLIRPLPAEETTESGLVLAATESSQRVLCQVGMVVKMGPLCYDTENRPEKYGYSAWCKEGDWVLYGKHSGTKFTTKDKQEWLIINDDSILAVVPEPSFITRLDYGI